MAVKNWPHPGHSVNVITATDSTLYPIEIFTDGSKIEGKVGSGVAIYKD